MNNKSFFGLTDLQVEVVGLDETIVNETMERRLFTLVLDWAKSNLNDLKPKLDRLTEKVNVLYLHSDNTLRDCADVDDVNVSSDDEMVQDYKKMARRTSKPTKGASPRSAANGGGAQPFHKFSLNPEEAVSVAEREWSIVATRKTSENAYLAIAVVDGQLMAVSAHVRLPPASGDSNSVSSGPDSPPISTPGGNGRVSPPVRKASINPLESMSTPRCAMGAVELNGQLIVCGGYDRGECLSSVEAFSIVDNKWKNLAPMNAARGRFSATVLDGCVYVCGGSDGWRELSCMERYDPKTGQWQYMARMRKERSSHGLATLNNKLYCVGGCEGQRSVASCEVYDPVTNKWSPIASLNMARSQTCVCVSQGRLYAIGGNDQWNTLNSVEVYNVEQDEWEVASSLNIARRGASVDVMGDKMIVAGGSDGTQSLVSTEIFDLESSTWTVGPPMITPRANLSIKALGSRLFAIGGFSGKKFLSTAEWLDIDDMEWFGHTPRQDAQPLKQGKTTPELDKSKVKPGTYSKEVEGLGSDSGTSLMGKDIKGSNDKGLVNQGGWESQAGGETREEGIREAEATEAS